jgi:hypothetical protein
VRRRLETSVQFNVTTNLPAYAAAYIEMTGDKAIQFLRQAYVLDSSRRDTTGIVEILKALSIHGNEGRTELRDQIVDFYELLLIHQPELAGYIAKDLTKWRTIDLASRMAEILVNTELDEPSELAVAGYLSSINIEEANAALQTFWSRRSGAATRRQEVESQLKLY